MYERKIFLLFAVTLVFSSVNCLYLTKKTFNCGPYGFVCEHSDRIRLCEGTNLFGPTFICPANTICNEDSNDVCENTVNYIDPSLSRSVRCRRNERIADLSVPGCKGYILCIPNKNRFQGIKFKCGGNTIFNGITRTCSSSDSYKCPLLNTTNTNSLYEISRRSDAESRFDFDDSSNPSRHKARPIDCKNYNLRVTQDSGPSKAAYFCPKKPVPGQRTTRCTVFSNHFCITLERYDEDQFAVSSGIAYRRPRISGS